MHNVHQTHLDQLDALARKHLKIWLKVPTRGVTDLGIFHPYLLGIKYPSQTYKEGHIGNFVNTTLVGDPVVREALRCQVERETVDKQVIN